ncbi:MAG: hypothetical protein MUC51_13385 [Anaerolineae bacterium]|nr:hypothetical protein [Anaerolineae bacterium]
MRRQQPVVQPDRAVIVDAVGFEDDLHVIGQADEAARDLGAIPPIAIIHPGAGCDAFGCLHRRDATGCGDQIGAHIAGDTRRQPLAHDRAVIDRRCAKWLPRCLTDLPIEQTKIDDASRHEATNIAWI